MDMIDQYLEGRRSDYVTVVNLPYGVQYPAGLFYSHLPQLKGIFLLQGRLALYGESQFRLRAPTSFLYQCAELAEYEIFSSRWNVIKSRYVDRSIVQKALNEEMPLVQLLHPSPIVRFIGKKRLEGKHEQ